MNTGFPSSSAGPSVSSNSNSSRKERGAIAAQACENCRQRKQRCSEERPKCASCVRMKLECQYREPQPTKKDRTLVEILDRLRSLENKVDELATRGTPAPAWYSTGLPQPQELRAPTSNSTDPDPHKSWSRPIPQPPLHGTSPQPQYEYISGAHKMLSWPFVQHLMATSEFDSTEINALSVQRDGLAVLMGLRSHHVPLPRDTLETNSPDQLAALDPSIARSGKLALRPFRLDWDVIRRQSKAYFDTFNQLYPIVDMHSFQTHVMPTVTTQGFDDSLHSTLALLVLSLGEVALEGSEGQPVAVYQGRPSGLKGGSPGRPPGLILFNEARKRMGFNLMECSIENVQLYALAALYYGTCCLHTEFWRMTSSASLACQALLTSDPTALESKRAGLIRRLFWHCSIMETCLNLEFNIPPTGLHNLEDIVGLPEFSTDDLSDEDYINNQTSHLHFATQIVLRRLSVDFHTTLNDASKVAYGGLGMPGAPNADPVTPTVISTTKDMASQLDQWRGLLPPHLNWADAPIDPFLDGATGSYGHGDAIAGADGAHSSIIFTTNLNNPAINYLYAEDIQAAVLRTRYLYIKYVIHRPFMYKALHHPQLMTQGDAEGVAMCLQSALLWPIAMSPIRDKKRLVPCLVFWTQNLFGILLLLHLSQQVPILIRIRNDLLGGQFAVDAKETVQLCIDWIRDLKDVDATATWCWMIVKTFFPVECS